MRNRSAQLGMAWGSRCLDVLAIRRRYGERAAADVTEHRCRAGQRGAG